MKPLLVPLLCVSALGFACKSDATGGGAPATPAVRAQWSGAYSDVKSSATRTAKTADEWNALWKLVRRDPPRALEPDREMAVAVFLGERNTGGHSVEIVSAAPQSGSFVVEYRETAPEPGMIVTQSLTQPWSVAIVPRSDLPVQFRRTGANPNLRHEK